MCNGCECIKRKKCYYDSRHDMQVKKMLLHVSPKVFNLGLVYH